jgi:hypothetical protein
MNKFTTLVTALTFSAGVWVGVNTNKIEDTLDNTQYIITHQISEILSKDSPRNTNSDKLSNNWYEICQDSKQNISVTVEEEYILQQINSLPEKSKILAMNFLDRGNEPWYALQIGKALEQINSLPTNTSSWEVIYNLHKTGNPTSLLKLGRILTKISYLPKGAKNISINYIINGSNAHYALEIGKALIGIDNLSEESRAIVQEDIDKGHSPFIAFEKGKEYEKKQVNTNI